MMIGDILILVWWYMISIADFIPVKVTIEDGNMRGQILTTINGRSFSAFTGIPFAKPPVGSLRFKAPEPNDPWNDTYDATGNPNICPQRNIFFRSQTIEGDEDCLYLNVYTPKLSFNQDLDTLPVMVFIHGGGFFSGCGNYYLYSPEILLDKDIVLVTTNYRLGPLGFFSTGDEVVPGNMGLKDQNMALKWVQKNIHEFGGNPERVTIFGESAGAASVHLHVLSPLSKNFFKGAIIESGTALAPWAFQVDNYVRNNSVKLAKELKCSTESNQQMVDCLRKVNARTIINEDKKFMEWDTDPMFPFKPVIEPDLPGAFLTQHPVDIIRSGKANDVPIIIGVNTHDGGFKGVFDSPKLIKEFEEHFDEIIGMSLELNTYLGPKTNAFVKKIKEFYYNNAPVDNSQTIKTIELYTDGWFLNPMDTSVRLHTQHNTQPVFSYLFEYRGSASLSEVFIGTKTDYGVCHADELLNLFPMRKLFSTTPMTITDQKVSDLMTTLWYNFASTGNPTPELSAIISQKWKPYSTNEEYYHITDVAKTESRMLPERTMFWRSIITEPLFGIKSVH